MTPISSKNQMVFNASFDPMAWLDPHFRVLDLNEPMLKMLGAKPDSEINLPDPWITILESKANGIMDLKWKNRYLRLKTAVSLNADQEVMGVLLIVKDRTDLCEMEEQLYQTGRMRAMGQLAAGVVHDFNNLLTGVLGYASLLKLEAKPDSLSARAAKVFGEVGERSKRLTSRLLGFVRKKRVKTMVVDLHQVIHDVVDVLTHTLNKNIRIQERLCGQRILVKGDPLQLEQALINLGINARDAMKDGGRLEFFTEISNSHGVIRIKDTGHGIPKEDMDRIFEPFFTTKGPGRGNGLGLSLVKRTVQKHGGRILVHSEEGRGTCFDLILPLEKGSEKEFQAPAEDPIIYGAGKVLVVDDESMVRSACADMLTELGYEPLVAKSADQAIELFKTHGQDVDLAIIDMIMPLKSGAECKKALEALNPQIKCLLCSGHKTQQASLIKPFLLSTFSQTISKALHAENAVLIP